jgi:hypothetical protein
MTTDHRVLSSIGWLNAGRLRRGDSLLISVPHYAGGVVKREPGQVASIIALLYLRGLSRDRRRQLEEELGMRTYQVRDLVDKGLMSLFDGWGDREAVNFSTTSSGDSPLGTAVGNWLSRYTQPPRNG